MRRMTLMWAVPAMLLATATVAFGQDYGALAAPEQQAMADTFQYALENNPSSSSADWVNPDTGTAGAVMPVKTFAGAGGAPCREFITTIVIGGREEQGYGTACRQPDGSWQIVADEQQAPPPPPPPRVEYVPAPQYYAYPTAFYAPYNIYLSFGYVYRSGHLYYGSHFLDGPAFRHRYPLHVRERVYIGPRIRGYYPGYKSREHDYRGRHDYRDRREYRDRHDYRDRREFRKGRWADPDYGRGDRGRRHR